MHKTFLLGALQEAKAQTHSKYGSAFILNSLICTNYLFTSMVADLDLVDCVCVEFELYFFQCISTLCSVALFSNVPVL